MVKKVLGEKKGGVPILSNFLTIFCFRKFLQVFDISRGKKTLFFKKCPNNGLVSEKNTLFFFHGRGGGGSDQSVKNFTDFFFFDEGFYLKHSQPITYLS